MQTIETIQITLAEADRVDRQIRDLEEQVASLRAEISDWRNLCFLKDRTIAQLAVGSPPPEGAYAIAPSAHAMWSAGWWDDQIRAKSGQQ